MKEEEEEEELELEAENEPKAVEPDAPEKELTESDKLITSEQKDQ